jgi:hypothetical protein
VILKDGRVLMVITEGAMKGRIGTIPPFPDNARTVQVELSGSTIMKTPDQLRRVTMDDLIVV